MRLCPGYPEAHYNLGVALAGQGELAAAARHLRRVLRRSPGNPDARRLLRAVEARRGLVLP